MVNAQNVDDVFKYHSPTGDQPAKYARIREACTAAAKVILEETEIGADQQAAIRKIREGMMTANASVATNNAA